MRVQAYKIVLVLTSRFNLFESDAAFFRQAYIRIDHCLHRDDLLFSLHQNRVCHAIVLDLVHRYSDALTLINALQSLRPDVPILVILPGAEVPLLVECLKQGAYDYFLDPPDGKKLAKALRRLFDIDWQQQLLQARRNNWEREKFLHTYEPHSSLMKHRFQQLATAARSDAPVTIIAHPHADREYYARLIHFLSFRRFQSFIRIDCQQDDAVIDEITQSTTQRKSDQNNATLFFEQISALPFKRQLQLIDFYDDMAYFGRNSAPPFRICSSLSPGAEKQYYRDFFKVLGTCIDIPCLRQRRQDIESMVNHLIAFYGQQWHKSISGIEAAALEKLIRYDWPGDFIELKNVLERAVIFCTARRIRLEDLPPAIQSFKSGNTTIELRLHSYNLVDAEELLIDHVLRDNHGNISRSASTLGISRGTLYNKLKKYGLEYLIRR